MSDSNIVNDRHAIDTAGPADQPPTANENPSRLFRLVFAGLLVAASIALCLSVLTSPFFLEPLIIANRNLGSDREQWMLHTTSVVLLAWGILLFRLARWTHIRSRDRSDAWLGARLIAAAMGLVVALGVGELAARSFLDWDQVVFGDDYWRGRWARRSPTAKSHYPMDRFDPQLGWTTAPHYRSETINTNSGGMRGQREYAREKPDGVRRIVVIGDSFTFGEYVTDDETYAAQLESLLPNTEVLNLGVHGYGLGQMHLRLLRDGFAYQPDLVIVAVYSNDIDRAVLSFRDFAKPRYVWDGDELTLTNTPIEPPETHPIGSPQSYMPRSYFLGAVHRLVWRYVNRSVFAPKWELCRRILDETLQACNSNKASVLVVSIPTTALGELRYPGKMLSAWAASNNTPYLNLAEVYSKMSDQDRARLYKGHWTPYGHQIAAKAIAEYIAHYKLLNAKSNATKTP